MKRGVPGIILLAAACLVSSSTLSCSGKKTGAAEEASKSGAIVFAQKPTATITFLSTQLNPVEEAYKMRNSILKDFPGPVDFRPNDNAYLLDLLAEEIQKGGSASILIGALHGDLVHLYEAGALRPLDSLYKTLSARGIAGNLLKLSKFDGEHVYYIPWMQASFVMAANRKALQYLPKGATLDALTYRQLAEWAENIYQKTGRKALGFPAGGKGLMHRFFQGYLYPSFTASTLLKFRN